ncbi:MAG: GAF domain-containing protein, partial [Candidatus Bipolaricaulia bacterium]
RILGRSMDLEAALEEALEQILRLSEFEIGGIALVDRERGILIPEVHRGIPRAVLEDIEREPFRLDEGLSGAALERGELFVIADLSRDPRVSRQSLKEAGLRTALIIPLLSQERIIGFLYLLSKRSIEVPPERLRLLQAIGDQLGVAVENFQLFQREQRRLSQLLLVEQIAAKASSILELDRLLDEVAVGIQRAFNYHDVLIFFVDQGRGELVRKAWAGHYYHRQGPKEERVPLGSRGILSWVVRHGQTALVNDVRWDARYEAFFAQTRSELCVPLKREGRVIGGINVESTQQNAFDETDAALLEALADQLAVAIANAELYQELEERVAQRTAALRASQERLQALSQVAARVQGALDEEQVLALAVEEFRRLAFIGSFWSVEEGGRAIVRRHLAFPPEFHRAVREVTGRDPRGHRLPLDQLPTAAQRAITRGEVVILDDLRKTYTSEILQAHPRGLEVLERQRGRIAYASLSIHGEPAWLMTLAFPQAAEADRRTVEIFACHLSIALENARLFRELKEA